MFSSLLSFWRYPHYNPDWEAVKQLPESDSMQKILQVSNYMYPHLGGIEQVTRDIACALKESGFEQEIVCFNENASEGACTTRRKETVRDEVDGVPVIRCGCITKVRSQSISLSLPKQLRETIRHFSPDTVIFHYPNPFAAYYLLRYLPPKIKLVLYWHLDIVKQKQLRHLFARQNNRLLRRADLVVATSPNYIDGSPWLQKVRDKCVVVPNCFSWEHAAVTAGAEEAASRIREENRGKIICSAVGRNVPYKGFSHLAHTAKLLDDHYVIYIAGKDTEELARETDGDPKVRLLGRVDEDTRKGLLLASDIFCFPSVTKNEAFGIALAEAMAFGKPAVTFRIEGSGVSYVCPDGECGIEVPNGNIVRYAEALRTLGENPALRQNLGMRAEERARDLFTPERFRENVLRALKNLDGKS